MFISVISKSEKLDDQHEQGVKVESNLLEKYFGKNALEKGISHMVGDEVHGPFQPTDTKRQIQHMKFDLNQKRRSKKVKKGEHRHLAGDKRSCKSILKKRNYTSGQTRSIKRQKRES